MHSLSIPYPDDLLITSGKSPQALEAELAFLLAVKFFELHRLSLGKAATFCRMDGYQLKPGQVACARDWSVVTKKTV